MTIRCITCSAIPSPTASPWDHSRGAKCLPCKRCPTADQTINFASQLEGKLLIVHGTGDDNVHYQGTERLINELVKHNRQFDLMSNPNRRHGIVEGEGTSLHMRSMMTHYFIEHLQGQ